MQSISLSYKVPLMCQGFKSQDTKQLENKFKKTTNKTNFITILAYYENEIDFAQKKPNY